MKRTKVDWILVSTILMIIVMAIVGICIAARADEKKGYDITETQKLRLEVKQKDAQIAQMQMQAANNAFQKSIADFNAESKAIQKENGWPDTVHLDDRMLAQGQF